jgi:periplasmic protein CpxP/Spy
VTGFPETSVRLKVVGGALAVMLALPAGVFAQGAAPAAPPGTAGTTPTPPPAAAPAPSGPSTEAPAAPSGQTRSRGRRTAQSPTERVAARIATLHEQLGITPAQEDQWNKFAQVMRDNASHMEQTLQQRSTGFANMTAVDNLNSYAAIAAEHAQDMQQLAAAFQPLYASFSDDQKKTADEVFRYRPPRHPTRARTQAKPGSGTSQ